MKKVAFFGLLLLCGCARPMMVKNDKCEDVGAVKISEVSDNFALGTACKQEYDVLPSFGYTACFGRTVYVPKEKGKLYYDDQIIKPEAGKCISFGGVYQYKNLSGVHTVPVVEFVDSELPAAPDNGKVSRK